MDRVFRDRIKTVEFIHTPHHNFPSQSRSRGGICSVPQVKCRRVQENLKSCTCSWPACAKKGNCCLCLQSHLSSKELPGCFFTSEVERTYDRSIRQFLNLYREGFRPTLEAASVDEVECPRREENEKVCPCENEDCEFHGICCLCMRSHMSRKSLPACVRVLV